jgi:hypothetical protein
MCPKIMTEEHCDICEKYYTMVAEAKKIEDKNVKEEKMKEAKYYKCATAFYYPILDRTPDLLGKPVEGKAKILKTTLSIRLKVDEKTALGKDVTKNDWIIVRTEKPGSDYYSLDSVDSADCLALSEGEIKEIEEAKTWNMEDKIGTKTKQSSTDFVTETEIEEETPNSEVVNPSDIPF